MAAALVLLGGATTASADGSAAAPVSMDGSVLDDVVREGMARAGVPGAAYAVVGPGGVVHQGTFGTDGDGRPVSSTTPFLWGSVSKPVTATLAVLLAGDGLLDLDARVRDLLPGFTTADHESAGRITVRQLLIHTSGLPEGLQLTDRYAQGRDPALVVGQIADLEPIAAPGERHSYSSLNYVVAAAVIEEVTGRSYGDVLAERLLQPAAMTAVLTDQTQAEDALPPGNRYVLGTARPFETRVDPATAPAGYLVGGLSDLAAFARINLPGGRVLDDQQRSLLHTAEAETGGDSGYGLGWRSWRVPGSEEPVVWHGGAAPGYQSAVLLLPERDLAVVVLQNAYGPFHEGALLDTAWAVASTIVGATPVVSGTDPTYPAALVVLGLLVILLLVVAVRSGWRVARPAHRQRTTRRRMTGLMASLVGFTAVAGGLLALPGLFGVQLDQLGLWAPDLSWLVHGSLVLTVMAGVLRVMVVLRETVWRTGDPATTDPPRDRPPQRGSSSNSTVMSV